MEKIHSLVDSGILCHIVNRMEEIQGRTDVAPDSEFLQLATLRMPLGKSFKPHQHIWKAHETEKTIAQESWVVIKGRVRCHFYDIDGSLLAEREIGPGDCSMTFQGGHTYTILEDDTVVYEYKTGPYTGQANDKIFL
jgi:hypothetical protein